MSFRHCTAHLLALALPLAQGSAQITVERNAHVSLSQATRGHDEVMMSADPTDPKRLVACSHVHPGPHSKQGLHTIAYLSSDGGRMWRPAVEDSATPPGVGYWTRQSWDPTCAYGNDGALYFASGIRTSIDPQNARVRLHRSFDGGRTWQKPVLVDAGYYDKPILVTDTRRSSPYYGRVYLAYVDRAPGPGHLSVASSTTRWEGMDTVVSIAVRDSLAPKSRLGPGPYGGVVLSDGALVVLMGGPEPVVVVSQDGGKTFAVRRVAGSGTVVGFGAAMGLGIAADMSGGPFNDRLYVTWATRIEGRDQIVVAASSDHGQTWSPPRVVNDDRPRAPGNGPDHLLPAIAVNLKGAVGVSWYDRREPADNLGWYIRFSASLDGGDSWLPSVRVAEQPHLVKNVMQDTRPRPVGSPPIQGELNGSLTMNTAGAGHFAGLAAGADGRFHPLWIDNRTGAHQVWTAAVRVGGNVAVHGDTQLSLYRDISRNVEIHLLSMTFNRTSATTATVDGDLFIENVSADTVRGPLVARFRRLTSRAAMVTLGRVPKSPAGAVLDLTPALRPHRGKLAPGAHAGPLPIRFNLTDIRSTDPTSEDLQVGFEGAVLAGPRGD